MILSVKGYITSKNAEFFSDCADRYALDKKRHKFAISDGVSKSFFPKFWAEVLVQNFVNSNNSIENLIVSSQKDWLNKVEEIINKPGVKWFTKSAFKRQTPGLATFVGLEFFQEEKKWYWKASALGDSFLFFTPLLVKDFDKECISLSSKETPILFDNYPDYFSSIGKKYKGTISGKEEVLSSGTFYLMTDALAEWFLNEKENAIDKIKIWNNQLDFERFVDEERLNGKLGNDDNAILMIEIREDEGNNLNYDIIDVSDIAKLIKSQEEELNKEVEASTLLISTVSPTSEESNKSEPIELIKENFQEEVENIQDIETKPDSARLNEESEGITKKSIPGKLFNTIKKGVARYTGVLGVTNNERQLETVAATQSDSNDSISEPSNKVVIENQPKSTEEQKTTELIENTTEVPIFPEKTDKDVTLNEQLDPLVKKDSPSSNIINKF